MKIDAEFAKLKDFQRATANYVIRRFFDDRRPTRRFLVADEVGMGKTLVARGVVAKTIERLRRADSGIDRIDVVYICSNQNIAQQNLRKLDVLGEGTKPLPTRITLLATHVHDLNKASEDGQKKVNLVALTPGTSFQKGHAGGRVEERALLAVLTDRLFRDPRKRKALRLLLQMYVGDAAWARQLRQAEHPEQAPDRDIHNRYLELLRASEVRRRLDNVIADLIGRRKLPEHVKAERNALVSDLRHLLARASVDALEPDLVILDEFQRFRHLMLAPDAEEASELNELANALFEHPDARVLLLSATPYKLYTLPEERGLPGGDDHYRDFFDTVRFLAHTQHEPEYGERLVRDLSTALTEFRDQLVSGGDPVPSRDKAQTILRRLMCRTERPVGDAHDMRRERSGLLDPPQADDLVSYARMQALAKAVDGDLSPEYWKSAPYFLNFMDGYQLSERVRARVDDPEIAPLLRARGQRLLRRSTVSKRRPIELGNARLRALQQDVQQAGLPTLLWLPPSMPYHEPGAAWAKVDPTAATKRLLFSSWAAAPSAIAALLSHETLRALEPDPQGHNAQRLNYTVDRDDRPSGMTALLLTVPQPGLAKLCDPLEIARKAPAAMLPLKEVLAAAIEAVRGPLEDRPAPPEGRATETWYWCAPLAWPGAPAHAALREPITRLFERDASEGLAAHLARADDAVRNTVELGHRPEALVRWVAMTGLASPANCAWRSLRRVTAGHDKFSEQALSDAAAMIGEGFRSLFNRSEIMTLLDRTFERRDQPYWQSVLEYCLAGNLQAVLDEHLHCLVGDENPQDDDGLRQLAQDFAETIRFDQGRVEAFDPRHPDRKILFNTRFAVRFGSARGTVAASDQATARIADIRRAFNSPFWPFVLASTSIGQEGVDFHWWCHSLVHWNLPANVVDLEQREGRIHRFKGHAVRKNVGAAYRASALRAEETDPWTAAFEEAARSRPDEMNELWPSWIYPGAAKIECWVPSLPLSREIERERGLKRDRGRYRLAFGQPRQEDLLSLIESGGYRRIQGLNLQPG